MGCRREPLEMNEENEIKKNSNGRRKKECNTRTSQEVTHPSTTLAQARLTSEF